MSTTSHSSLGVPVKGGPVKEGIEVFPRQDRIEDGEYGNAIRAPLGVHRRTNQRYWFYDAAFTPEAQLAYLNGLKKLTETELRALNPGIDASGGLSAGFGSSLYTAGIFDPASGIPDPRLCSRDAQGWPQLDGTVPILRADRAGPLW